MVKFKVRHNILFKPKWKFVKISSLLKKQSGNTYIRKKEFLPSLALNSLESRKKRLILLNNIISSKNRLYLSLTLKKIWYRFLKSYSKNIYFNLLSRSPSEVSTLDNLCLKFQNVKAYVSTSEQRKYFLKEFLKKKLSLISSDLKKKSFIDKMCYSGALSTAGKENFDFTNIAKRFLEFNPKIHQVDASVVWNPQKKKLLNFITKDLFIKKVIQNRIFLYNTLFRKKYKRIFNFFKKNRYELLLYWLKSKNEKKIFEKKKRRVFLKKRSKKNKWFFLAKARKYRKQLRVLKNVFPYKTFELNFKTFSFLFLGSVSSLKNGVKIPFDLEVRKLLNFLST